ncbi:MAG: DNA gyrase C-terminal beta-propeller domain-containing protein, partial [Kiloniellales bacterium]
DWPATEVASLIKLIDEPGRDLAEDGTYRLSEVQAKAILELRLQRLTGLERAKVAEELGEIAGRITEYLAVLRSRERLLAILRAELEAIKERYANPRRTVIEDAAIEHDEEDLIQREDMVVTISLSGYIKRVPLSTYRAQRRGGKGRAGMATREEDFVSKVFVCNTHTPMLFFSSRGMVYKMKVYRLPIGSPQARGKALINLLPLRAGETITTAMPLPEDESSWADMYVMFATSGGGVRRNRLSDFTHVMANGKIAMKLEEHNGRLVSVRTCTDRDDVLLANAGGKCIRFPVTDVRVFSGRTSTGVRGIKLLDKDDEVISMTILDHMGVDVEVRDTYLRYANAKRRAENGDAAQDVGAPKDFGLEISKAELDELEDGEQFILSIAADGLGKRSSAYEYRITGRGGQGIVNMDLSRGKDATPRVAGAFPVNPGDQIVLVTDAGKLIRCPVHDIRIAGRSTRGVRLFNVAEDERVVSVARLADDGEAGELVESGEMAGEE